MRVAIVTTSYPAFEGDGAGHFVAAEADALIREGHEVVVIAPGRRSTPPDGSARVLGLPDGGLFGWPGALERLRQRPLRAFGALAFVLHARRALERNGPFDRVIAHFLVPSGFPIALGSGAKLEVVCHGSDVGLLLELPGFVARAIVGRLLRENARFRFVSRALRDALAAKTGHPAIAQAEVAPCAISLDALPTRDQSRRALGIAAEERLIVVVGRLVASKRSEVALGAAALIPHARVVVVGDGPERSRLSSRFPDALIAGAVPRPRALEWMAAADVLISASRSEGAPTAIREARALGVPVVATPAGDLAEWAEADAELVLVR